MTDLKNTLFQWFEQPLIVLAALLIALCLVLAGCLFKALRDSRSFKRRCEWLSQRSDEQLSNEAQLHAQLAEALERAREQERELVRQSTMSEQYEQQLREAKRSIALLTETKEAYLKLEARFQEKERQLNSKEALMDESKKSLLKEFELAANKLFESKQQNFQQLSKQNLETILSPFRQQLSDFNRQVDEVYHKENTQRNQLIGQIGELQKQAQQISKEASDLTAALKGDNKVQGQWGEIVLERLLSNSGLEKGREYHTQYNIKSEGKNLRPDVVIHLPDDKDIVIDSKVALIEYERFANETDKDLREKHLKCHVDALKVHIRGLSLKRYENMEGLRTLDFVFMFVPIEAAYVAAVQHSPAIFSEAMEKNIMLVSPSSLMVALRMVETMWRYEKQNANAERIAQSAGKLYDQFVLLMNALEDVGTNIGRASESYDLVIKRLSQGRGNVMKKIDDLKKLGAKTSKTLSKTTMDTIEIENSKVAVLSEEETKQ